jgi:peroxiredoxin family protein
MLVGCARNDGRKTFEFLKAEHDIVENTKVELKQSIKPVRFPTPPVFSASVNRSERIAKTKQYHDALNNYWNTIIQNSQQAERILNDAETKISGLDSAEAGDDAINLTKGYESSFGDRVQVFVEIEALAKLEQTKLNKNEQSHLIASVIPGILETVATDNPAFAVNSFLKGASSDLNQENKQDQEIQAHLTRLQEMMETFKHDSGDLITKRSELVTSYRAKYPKFSWDELVPTAGQTNTNKVN